jgi:hypothetical protein
MTDVCLWVFEYDMTMNNCKYFLLFWGHSHLSTAFHRLIFFVWKFSFVYSQQITGKSLTQELEFSIFWHVKRCDRADNCDWTFVTGFRKWLRVTVHTPLTFTFKYINIWINKYIYIYCLKLCIWSAGYVCQGASQWCCFNINALVQCDPTVTYKSLIKRIFYCYYSEVDKLPFVLWITHDWIHFWRAWTI